MTSQNPQKYFVLVPVKCTLFWVSTPNKIPLHLLHFQKEKKQKVLWI